MASRSGRRRVHHSSPLVDLDDVFADDALIDAIAAGPWRADGATTAAPGSDGPFDTGSPLTAEPLAELFGQWRDELARTPFPEPPVVPKAADVVAPAKPPRRSHRPAMAIAAAIAALLVGSTFVGSRQATPDSALWNVTAVLWPDRVESVASRNKVRSAIALAETALSENRTQDAQDALLDASFEIGNVDDADGRQGLQSSLEDLWKKAAPADQPAGSDRQQLVAGGSSSSTTSAVPTSAAQQAAAGQSAAVNAPVTVPPGTQVAVADLAGVDPGTVDSSPTLGTASGSGGIPSAAAAVAVQPAPSGNSLESGSDTPTSSSSPSTPPVALEPPTEEPTEQSPIGGSTEPAVAPTPTEPTPTSQSPESIQTEESQNQAELAGQATESTVSAVTDTTVVPPTP